MALLGAGVLVRFSHDEVMMLQGDVGDCLYVLTDGKVKVLVAAKARDSAGHSGGGHRNVTLLR